MHKKEEDYRLGIFRGKALCPLKRSLHHLVLCSKQTAKNLNLYFFVYCFPKLLNKIFQTDSLRKSALEIIESWRFFMVMVFVKQRENNDHGRKGCIFIQTFVSTLLV